MDADPQEAPTPAKGTEPLVSKAEQSRRTRSLIKRTAIKCLAKYGYAQTTFLLIAQEAGISRGPLHYHFADKNALMGAVAEALPQLVEAATMETIRRATTASERLEAIISLAIDQHTGPHHFAAIEILLAARNDPLLAAAVMPHFKISETAIDEWWVDYFSVLGWPAERLLALRHLAVSCLRGLAIDTIVQKNTASHQAAIDLFREMFMQFGTVGSRAWQHEVAPDPPVPCCDD